MEAVDCSERLTKEMMKLTKLYMGECFFVINKILEWRDLPRGRKSNEKRGTMRPNVKMWRLSMGNPFTV